jgi:hypothetical protein
MARDTVLARALARLADGKAAKEMTVIDEYEFTAHYNIYPP